MKELTTRTHTNTHTLLTRLRRLVEMLDMPRIEKLEEFVGTLTTVELNERYERCRLSVAKTLTRP